MSNSQQKQKQKLMVVSGYIVGILAMVIVGVFSWSSVAAFSDSANEVAASNARLLELRDLTHSVSMAESETRGYILTGNKAHLAHLKTPASILLTLDDLHTLTKDPQDRLQIEKLTDITKERLNLLAQDVKTYDESGERAARDLVRDSRSLALTTEFESIAERLANNAQVRINALTKLNEDNRLKTDIFLPLGIGFSLLAFVITSFFMLRDLARVQRAEAGLKRVNAMQSGLLNSAAISVVATDAKGVITFVNRTTEKMLGYDSSELVGQKVPSDLYDRAQLVERARQFNVKPGIDVLTKPALEHGAYEDEWLCNRKDGTQLPVFLAITPLMDDEGTLHGFVGTSIDLSEQVEAKRKVQEQVAQLEKAHIELAEKNYQLRENSEELKISRDEAVSATKTKSEFLANMSHEIRTPLNGVIGTTHLLLDTDLSEKQRSYVQLVGRSAENLLSILNDILDLSKMEAGKMSIERSPFDLRDTIEDVGEQFAAVAHQKQLALNLIMAPNAPHYLVGDSSRLKQVLANLVTNAIKFTSQGKVDLEAALVSESSTTARYRITVRDTGMGIPQDKLDAIFESFAQAEAGVARKFGGTGLGLAISRQLAELMGGEIGVASELGKGSEFWIETTFEKQALDQVPNVQRNLNGISVLLAEDNETDRTVLRSMMEAWNCTVAEAHDGSEALQALTEGGYDIAVLDMDMPEETGAEVARRIRSTRGSQDIPLVLVSSSTKVPRDSEVAGLFQGILNKPVRSSLFYETLSNALRAHVEPITPAQESKAKKSLAGIRVLVVEDNPINQLVVTEMLKTWGCSVVAVDNGRKAVDRTAVDKFNLVLMDVQMPEMDGLEATAAIRAREAKVTAGEHLPIIAMTANAMRGDEERCIASGMDLYLSKPIEPKKMIEAMSTFLKDAVLIEEEESAAPIVVESMPAFDVQQLEQSTSGKAGLQVQVLGRYLEGLSSQMARLTDAIQMGNRPEIRSISHSLKGSSWTVGAVRLADAFRQLESGAESLSTASLQNLCNEAEDAVFDTRNSIQERLSQLQHATQ